MSTTPKKEQSWWKEATIYQIYPRSFNDSNGDGIGDLRGIIEKLDYLKELGVDVLWLSPFYSSPNDDNGYDISDYYGIMEEFGTMADFEEMMAEAKKRGLKIIIDLVVNHSSDEHAWFKESRKSKDNPYRDYYIWKPPVNGGPPNDWVSFFSGSAWEYDEATGEYYLHYFTRKQPDLNWENPKMRHEIYQMMHFWLKKGVSGFRMDVIPLISKDPDFKPFPDGFDGNFPVYYASGPRVHEFLQEMHREVLSKADIMTVGEGIGVLPEEVNDYVGSDRNELNMIFHFGHMFLDRKPEDFLAKRPWKLTEFKQIFRTWEEALGEKGWGSIFLGNHDFPRMVSRFGNDSHEYREIAAKMLATLLFTLKGSTYVYQGDEIGMTNVAFPSIEEYNDVQTLNAYKAAKAAGQDMEAYMQIVHEFSRDNARTPVQWSGAANAGFTEGTPWLDVNPNFSDINVADAVENPDSIWHYYRQLIRLRKTHKEAWVYGDMQYLDFENEQVFAYLRTAEKVQHLIALNFTAATVAFALPEGLNVAAARWVIGNYPEQAATATLQLRPYEARVYKM